LHVRFAPSLHDLADWNSVRASPATRTAVSGSSVSSSLSAARTWEVDCISAFLSPLMSHVNRSRPRIIACQIPVRAHFVGGIRLGVGSQDVDTVSTGRLWARPLSDTALGSNAAMRPRDHPTLMERTMGEARQSPHDRCVDLATSPSSHRATSAAPLRRAASSGVNSSKPTQLISAPRSRRYAADSRCPP